MHDLAVQAYIAYLQEVIARQEEVDAARKQLVAVLESEVTGLRQMVIKQGELINQFESVLGLPLSPRIQEEQSGSDASA